MPRTIDIQFFGSAIVIAAFAAAEGAVRLLDVFPGSPFAWYLNLRVFGLFEAARTNGSALQRLFHPASFEVALALLAILMLARVCRLRFGLALAANLSFVATLFLASVVLRGAGVETRSASLHATRIMPTEDSITLATLVITSSTAFLASHISFARAMVRERVGKLTGASGESVGQVFRWKPALSR